MRTYESKFFGIRMQIPDGWDTTLRTDEGLEELATGAANWIPTDPTNICFHRSINLVKATLFAPGSRALLVADIELVACIQTDESMHRPHGNKQLTKMNLNGVEILYYDDSRHRSQESVYYRFPRWKVSPGLWLYAKVMATGSSRFDYAWSIFETLTPTGLELNRKEHALYQSAPWNAPPSLFHLSKELSENGPLYDLTHESEIPSDVLNANQAILNGTLGAATNRWTSFHFRRKSRVRSADCYYGPDDVSSSGVFSERAVEVFQPHLHKAFSVLPCTVNNKPYYFLQFNSSESLLDLSTSLVRRFVDGRIMTVERPRFLKDAIHDPMVFAVPEMSRSIFVTASVPKLASEAGLKGIAFYPVDGNGRDLTFPDENSEA